MTDHTDDIRERFAQAEDVAPDPDLSVPEATPHPDDGMGDMDDGPPPHGDEEGPDYNAGAALPLNDTGNGRRFALYFGDQAQFFPRIGWHCWDGRRWCPDDDELRVRGLAQKIQEMIEAEIPFLRLTESEQRNQGRHDYLRAELRGMKDCPDGMSPEEHIEKQKEMRAELDGLVGKLWGRGSTRARHISWAKSSGNSGAIKNMLVEATVQLGRDVEDMDADPLTVNTESGLMRFSVEGGGDAGFSKQAEMEMAPHDREVTIPGRNAPQYITKMMPVEYDPNAEAPLFEAFLRRVQPDRALRQFLQRWFGLSMTAMPVQKFAFFYGSGANGKSVLVDLMARIMGDYSHAAKIESFTGRNRRGGGDATPDIFPLIGARMVRSSEPDEGERLQEGLIKELTGGEPLLVRKLHGDFIEAHPFFKLTISGNHKPDIRGTDDGIWRRILLVPFDQQIPENERDEHLIDKLFAERSGILNWMVEGLTEYLEGGLQEPDAVLAATQDYRTDSDPIGSYLRECCIVSGDPADFMTARDLMDGFNLWLDLKGEGMWGARTVSLKLKAQAGRYKDPATRLAYATAKQKVTGYRGIRFQDLFKTEFDEAPRNKQGHPMAYSESRRTGGDEDIIT